MVAVLHQIGGGRVIAIDRAVILVGRSADCDVVITASQKISRRHCCLVQVDNGYYLRDLGSMNGVWLNGGRVNRETPMTLGDKITIGDVEFLFHPNARIQKKAQSTQSNGSASPKEKAAAPVPPSAEPQPLEVEEILDAEIIEDIGEFEVIDDVIPLGEDGIPLVETNEVEIIDEPIIHEPLLDLDDLSDFDEDIIPLND